MKRFYFKETLSLRNDNFINFKGCFTDYANTIDFFCPFSLDAWRGYGKMMQFRNVPDGVMQVPGWLDACPDVLM